MDSQAARVRRARKRTVPTGSRRRGDGEAGQRQLLQLLICLALFLVVFLGKGIFPARLTTLREDLSSLISSDTDFRAVLSELGASFSGEGALLERFRELCAEVFGQAQPAQEVPVLRVPDVRGRLGEESKFLAMTSDRQEIAEHLLTEKVLRVLRVPLGTGAGVQAEPEVPADSEALTEPEPVPAAGTVLSRSDYSGQALPENYTMDQLSLGDLETVTPVLGHINSIYGYRDHPINGKYQFHGGVDIGGQYGDTVKAFAAGTVEYIGEDDSYGLYLQLKHSNGIKSFYAHCRSICVQKGQTVALGEKIAEVGSTGSATGPHLHLELKYNKLHLNPVYYIEYLSDR